MQMLRLSSAVIPTYGKPEAALGTPLRSRTLPSVVKSIEPSGACRRTADVESIVPARWPCQSIAWKLCESVCGAYGLLLPYQMTGTPGAGAPGSVENAQWRRTFAAATPLSTVSVAWYRVSALSPA